MDNFYWSLFLILFHTWMIYFVSLIILSKLKLKCFRKENLFPSVSVLLTVHNEEKLIEKRINNLFEMDYPRSLLEILVASDGSTDKTNEIVESMSKRYEQIRLFKTEGGGKSFTQNKAIPSARGEIIVLTDADTVFDKDAIRNIIKNFADDKVGCVSGKLILLNKDNSVSEGQGFYWKYEMLLRKLESNIGLLHTASGAIMAFRKSLFRPFESKYGDDCVIPLDIIAQNYKVIHDDDAIAYDSFSSTMSGELKVRTRMTLRNITGTLSRYYLLNPLKYPLISFSILSHKILRWLTPYFMVSFLVTNYFLLNNWPFYKITFCCQVIFYFLGIIGFIGEKKNFRIPLASQIFSFILANVGFFLGVLKAISGQNISSYKNAR